MAVKFEARPYGPDCTDEEREALLARVEDLGDGVIKLTQIPVSTDFSVELLLSRVVALGRPKEKMVLLADLREASLPSASQRRVMRARLTTLENLQRVVIVNNKNPLFALVARFILSGMMGVEIRLVGDLDDGLELARHGQ